MIIQQKSNIKLYSCIFLCIFNIYSHLQGISVYIILISNLSEYVILRMVFLLGLPIMFLWTGKGYLATEIVSCSPRFSLKHKTYFTQEIFKSEINVDLLGMPWHSVRIFAVRSYFCLIYLWNNNSDDLFLLQEFFFVLRRAVCNF